MVIREVKKNDYEEVGNLLFTVFDTFFKKLTSHPEMQALKRENFDERMFVEKPGQFDFVLEMNGEIAGFLRGKIGRNFEYDSEIISLHVLPKFHRNGIGKRLFQYALNYLRNQQCHSVFLWCATINTQAVNFYTNVDGIQVERHMSKLGLDHHIFWWSLTEKSP